MAQQADRVRIVGFDPAKPISDIIANPSNWRVHSERQSEYMKSVLSRVGWIDAVIVNQNNGHIIDGHLRYELATQSGAVTVPAVIVDLTADEELLALSTFDAIGSMADTDSDILGSLLDDVRGSFGSDIDLLLTGISELFVSASISASSLGSSMSGVTGSQGPAEYQLMPRNTDGSDAPFPWFGGKRRVSSEVWARFGDVVRYIEPFAGSLAVLLDRKLPFNGDEVVNDKDGLIVNFWRSVKHHPDDVVKYSDNPVFESDLHARHAYIVSNCIDGLTGKLEGDPEYCDPKLAGWWVWGLSLWVGGGWCDGSGSWSVIDGKLTQGGDGVVSRKKPSVYHSNRGVMRKKAELHSWFSALSERLSTVRVLAGDWERSCTDGMTTSRGYDGYTGVFLDPPYSAEAGRNNNLYRVEDNSVAHRVREWAITHGDYQNMRIALCGYEGEHDMPDSWSVLKWHTAGAFTGAVNENSRRERIWFSPHCLPVGTVQDGD